MTKEEAIRILEKADSYVGIHYVNGVEDPYISPCLKEAIEIALSALRPVSREQVEKVWRGEWKHTHSSDNFWTEVWVCSRCGLEDDNGDCFDFCPSCGSPMTDEAVEMVMERLEALHETI